jgi:ribosomal protein S18 acetylase RimI-like enzyme
VNFSDNYQEDYTLASGETVRFRLVRPDDKPAFVSGLELCSPLTIYNRFMGAKPRFSESDLKYLTEADPVDHVAIVGFRDSDLVAVGRAIRYARRPDAADFGLIVADCCQRQGIGAFLLNRLVEALTERNIRYMCGEMFSTNSAMFRVVDDLPYITDWVLDGSVASFEIDLSSPKMG